MTRALTRRDIDAIERRQESAALLEGLLRPAAEALARRMDAPPAETWYAAQWPRATKPEWPLGGQAWRPRNVPSGVVFGWGIERFNAGGRLELFAGVWGSSRSKRNPFDDDSWVERLRGEQFAYGCEVWEENDALLRRQDLLALLGGGEDADLEEFVMAAHHTLLGHS